MKTLGGKNISIEQILCKINSIKQGYSSQEFSIQQIENLQHSKNGQESDDPATCTSCNKNINGNKIIITNKITNKTIILSSLLIHLMKRHGICSSELIKHLNIEINSSSLMNSATTSGYLNYKRDAYEEFHSYH